MKMHVGLGMTVALLAASSSALAYTKIEAFGDSLSDNGNLYALTQAKIGVGLPVSPPYYDGRFSNGPVAVEIMAADMGLHLDDYAYGGAKTGTGNVNSLLNGTGIQSQVNKYVSALSSAGQTADPNALYFVWGGANDMFANITSTTVASTAAANMESDITTLYNAGARDFFVPLMPDLSLTPWAATQDAATPGDKQASLDRTNEYTGLLTSDLGTLSSTLPGINIQVFDTLTLQRNTFKLLGNLGYNTTTPCLTGDYTSGGTVCSDPSHYIFWDDVHPTAVIQQSLGDSFAVAAVPETSPTLMMLVGGLAVWVQQRSRKARRS